MRKFVTALVLLASATGLAMTAFADPVQQSFLVQWSATTILQAGTYQAVWIHYLAPGSGMDIACISTDPAVTPALGTTPNACAAGTRLAAGWTIYGPGGSAIPTNGIQIAGFGGGAVTVYTQ